MKKLLLLLLSLSMVLSLTACKNSQENPESNPTQGNTAAEPADLFAGKWVFAGGEIDGESMSLTYLSALKDYVLSIEEDRAEFGPEGEEKAFSITRDDEKNANLGNDTLITILDDGTLKMVSETKNGTMTILFARENSDAAKAFEEAYLAEEHKYESPTVDEKLLYDNNDIKVTLTGIESNEYTLIFYVTVENNRTTGDVAINPQYVVINGIQMASFAENEGFVNQGINETTWTVYRNYLEAAGISEITSIDTDINVYYSNRSEQTGLLELYANGKQPQTASFDGPVIYATDKVKVVYVGYKKNGLLGTPEVYYYVENNTAQNMFIQTENFKTDTDSQIWTSTIYLNPGVRAVGVIGFYEKDDPAELSMDFLMSIEGNYIYTDTFSITLH